MNHSIWNYLQQTSIPLVIIVVTIVGAWIFRKLYQKFIKHSSGIMNNDPTNYKFIGHALTALIYTLGFSWAVYEVPQMRQVANSLLAGAGILAVAAGFASQHALSNIISGLFIIIFKPFRVNDRLSIRGSMNGFVEDITLRHTVIRDYENRRIIIPNTVISDEIIVNFDFVQDNIVRPFILEVAMNSDINRIKTIVRKEVEKHPFFIDVRKPEDIAAEKPKVPVRVVGFTELGIKIKIWTWAENASKAFEMTCDLMENIKKEFDQQGIKMACRVQHFTADEERRTDG